MAVADPGVAMRAWRWRNTVQAQVRVVVVCALVAIAAVSTVGSGLANAVATAEEKPAVGPGHSPGCDLVTVL
jgi:hypothetical protein